MHVPQPRHKRPAPWWFCRKGPASIQPALQLESYDPSRQSSGSRWVGPGHWPHPPPHRQRTTADRDSAATAYSQDQRENWEGREERDMQVLHSKVHTVYIHMQYIDIMVGHVLESSMLFPMLDLMVPHVHMWTCTSTYMYMCSRLNGTTTLRVWVICTCTCTCRTELYEIKVVLHVQTHKGTCAVHIHISTYYTQGHAHTCHIT